MVNKTDRKPAPWGVATDGKQQIIKSDLVHSVINVDRKC